MFAVKCVVFLPHGYEETVGQGGGDRKGETGAEFVEGDLVGWYLVLG